MALMPASRAALGVSKSGSPTERLMIFLPEARSSAALAVIASVADGLTFERRFDSEILNGIVMLAVCHKLAYQAKISHHT